MSKSTGNSILPEELFTGTNSFFEKPIPPMVLRFFMLQAHYRSVLDLSNEAILAAEKGFHRLMEAYTLLVDLPTGDSSTFDVLAWRAKCQEKMDDDFNTPMLIAVLFEGVKKIHAIQNGEEKINVHDKSLFIIHFKAYVEDVLGLSPLQKEENNTQLKAAVQLLIEIRNQARAKKDFALSDEIRDELSKSGIQLKDGKDGTTFNL